MLNSLPIPQLVSRDRFIKRVLANNGASFVAGDEGWACVPFKRDASREIVLFWSSRGEAERWSEVVAINPQVHDVSLGALLGEVLPMLASRRALVGSDWSTDPSDPVVEAEELALRLWRERSETFMASIRQSQSVWVLESASGPATLPSRRQADRSYIPVWAKREDAVALTIGEWSTKRPIAVSLDVFAQRYIPFLEQRGWFVGPEPLPGAGTQELSPPEFTMAAFPQNALSRLRSVG